MEVHDAAPRTVVVIGAGISGLAAAWELTSRAPDARVIVIDGAATVGGKLALVQVGGLTVDAGAEALLARRPEAIDLATEVGLGEDLVNPLTTSAGVWSRGQMRSLPRRSLMGVPAWSTDAVGLLTVDEAARIDSEPDASAVPLEEDVDVASYVAGRVGPAVVDRLVEPLLGGVYAGHASRLSLRSTLPVAWEAAHAGRSLVGLARERAAAPDAGGPVFTGIRGGVARLALAVADALTGRGVEIRTGVMARELRRRPQGGWQVVVGSRADEQVIDAHAVLIAIPARPASRLLGPSSPAAAQALAQVEAASMALVAAVLPDAAALVTEAGSGFLVPPIDGHLVKAATYSSAKWGWLGEAAGDDLVVRLSIGRQGDEAVLQRDDADLVSAALADLGAALGSALPAPIDSRVIRWGGGLPQYAVGHAELIASIRSAVAALPGVAVCGAYLDGLGVPACIATARRAAADIASRMTP